MFFLFVYSQAGEHHAIQVLPPSSRSDQISVREPLDKIDGDHSDLDVFEVILYVMALAFAFEGVLGLHAYLQVYSLPVDVRYPKGTS